MSATSSSAHRFFVNSKLRAFKAMCVDVSEEQAMRIMRQIGQYAKERAPRGETGDLQSSEREECDTKYGIVQARIIFGSKSGMKYVVVQHEHTDFKHPKGGEAKFLEKAVEHYTPRVAAWLADAYRRGVIGGGGG
jgi:hypothetical protein